MAVGNGDAGDGAAGPNGSRAVFRGVSELVLDAKGRVAIPARHRDGLAGGSNGRVVITADHGGCLLLYPQRTWEPIQRDLMSLSSDSEMRVLKPLGPVIDTIAASRLRLTHDRVHHISFVRLHQGDPFSHTVVWLPPEIAALVADHSEINTEGATSATTVIGLLDQALEHPIQDAEQSITVGTAGSVVASELQVEPGTPLLRADRMYFDSSGSPVELAVSHFHPDRYSYRVRLRRNFP